jgi:hypothetical protein
MLPGFTQTFPRTTEPEKGTGKVWSSYSGAATAYPPPARLVDCWRCKGSGLVEERRKRDRRQSDGRRSSDDYMSAIRATMRRKRQNTTPETDHKAGRENS